MAKICYLLGGLNRGGLEHLVLDIFTKSKKNNLDLICIHRNDGVLKEKFVETGIQLIKHKPSKLFFITYLIKLRNIIQKNKINVVHAHVVLDAFFAILALRNKKVKIILTIHGYDYQPFIYKIILNYVLKKTDLVIFVSDAVKDYYIEKYKINPTKTKTIYNGVNLDKLKSDSVYDFKHELSIPTTNILLGMVSNFVNKGKDQITLCKAMLEIGKIRDDIHLVFIGSIDNEHNETYIECYDFCVKNNLLKNIHFVGERDNINELIKSLDYFTYSSNHDTFGIAIVEAMLLRTPVIMNDLKPFLEISENGKYATIFESKNINDFIEKLFKEIKLDLVEKNNKVEAAFEKALKSFSIEAHIQEISKTYSNIID
jgi:glycosyltransferase involved in cell wall biosynthesis